jgi:hypothetical protein
MALCTCALTGKRLFHVQAWSHRYPRTTFLLFDVAQLIVYDIQAAVCAVVRQCLLCPTRSPLHNAAEHFSKQLLLA